VKAAILVSLVPQTAIYYAILMEEKAINKFFGTELFFDGITTGCISIWVGMFAWYFCYIGGVLAW